MTDEEETDSESESEKAPPAKKPKSDDEGSKSESVRDPDIRYNRRLISPPCLAHELTRVSCFPLQV